jgi:hypothetical protein
VRTPAVDTVDKQGRPIRSVGAFALVVLLVVALGIWIDANKGQPLPAAAMDAAASETPAGDRSSTRPSSPPPNVRALGSPELLPVGRHSLHGAGIPISFSVPSSGWARFGGLYISKNTIGPQDAEAVIFWTGVWRSPYARACGQWWGSPGGDLAGWAAEASRARGTHLIEGPEPVAIGGHAAQHVVLDVRKDLACEPGLFHTWKALHQGPFWASVDIGDRVRIWLVEVGRKTLYIEADTHHNARSDIKRELSGIVESIRFD